MDGSVFFAQLLGPLFVVGGLGILMNFKKAKKMIDDLEKNYGMLFMISFFMIIISMAIVLSHNVWELSWKLIITLVGWGMLIKGSLLMLVPDQMLDFSKKLLKKRDWLYQFGGAIWILGGLCLVYFGFFA